jgi:hypothetical protein
MVCSTLRLLLRSILLVTILSGLEIGSPPGVLAHEIPANVTVRAFVKPEGDRLRVLLRVPLESIRDINFPVRGPGFLELDRQEPYLYAGARLWLADFLAVYEDGERLAGGDIVATRISLPSDRSFGRYEDAIAHIYGDPLPLSTDLIWQQALLDVLIEYPISSAEGNFAIEPELGHLGLRTTTILHFVPPTGEERIFQYVGDPGLVRLDPGWYHAAMSFVKLGFEHILEGIDHILFVLLLVIPVRRFLPLVAIITSFTVAHSITLIASAIGLAPSALWFPPFIETLIALSIVFMAFENIVGTNLQRRWMFAFGFGLVHGFGFSFLLRESLQFAGSHLLMSLLAFNVGVELGQILVVAIAIPLLTLLYRYVVAERMGVIILSALIAHTAWHWMTERFDEFAQHQITIPAFNLSLVASLMRWAILALILFGAVRLLSGTFRGIMSADTAPPPRPERKSARAKPAAGVGS